MHAEGVQIWGTHGQHKCGAGCFCTLLFSERLGELYRVLGCDARSTFTYVSVTVL